MSETESAECDFAAVLGLDWADEKHAWALEACEPGARLQKGELEHTPEAVEEFAVDLARRFPGRKVAVGLEQSRGALLYMLIKYEHLVLYPIHPNRLKSYRESLRPSGAVDDPHDAFCVMDFLKRHRDQLQPLKLDTVETRTMQFLCEARRSAVGERTRYSNQLTALVKAYFPQILKWFEDVDSPLVCDLLSRWPTLEALRKAKAGAVEKFLTGHGCRRKRIEDVLPQIPTAQPATQDRAVMAASPVMVKASIEMLMTLRRTIAGYDTKIAELVKGHEDYAIFQSFPQVGPVFAPRLIVAFGTQRDRFASAAEVQCYSGIAPVVESSGKQKWVHWRWACPKFVRQTFHEWANCTLRKCEWARTYYRQLRANNKSHHAALRALAFKWIRILFRCWKDRKLYDESCYLASVSKRARNAPTPQPVAVKITWKRSGGFSKAIAIST